MKNKALNEDKTMLPGILSVFLAISTLGLIGWSQWQPPSPVVIEETVQWQRYLVFADGPKGEILVRDHVTGQTIAAFEGEQGFVRGTLRALARERKRREVGSEHPFELTARTNGRLVLRDPSTAQRIDLDSFGPGNAALFRNLRQAGQS